MIFRTQSVKHIFIVSLLLILGGCSVWENFTTYFNLYYNTATLFEDAENEILSQKRDLFSNDPLIIPGNSKTVLTKVVEKCSKLLQFYSSSSYVDEALMMLGKSFYYQSNFQKSKRKFEELIATNPDDEIVTGANLWIAKCLFEMREFTEALKIIQDVRDKAVEQDYENIIKESYVQEIKYRIKKEEYTLSISLSKEFAEVYDDDVVRAKIYYELGNLYKITNDNQNAILAYEKVFDYEPDFDLEIIATIKYANSLRDAGQTEKALEVFEDIRNKDKFLASYNEIDFEIGKTLVQLGKYEKAFDQFRLVDTTYKNSSFASASKFEIGELYRTRFMNYDSAAYFYSKAATSNPPKEYLEKSKNNNQLFTKYVKLRKDIDRFDKQLYYSQNPEIYSKDSSDYVADSLKLLTEYLEKKEMQDIWKGVDTMFNYKNRNIKDSTFIKDSLFVLDSLVKVDSLIRIGLFNPADTIGLRKSILDTLNARNLARLKDPKDKKNLFNQLQGGVKLDSVKFKKNPPQKLKVSIDSAKTVLSKSSLELGNLFLAELNVPDSALGIYTIILDKYSSPVYYPNTLYALGSYYLTINKNPVADSLFAIIYDDYKDRTIVNAAANKLNKPLIDLKFDPAKQMYAASEDLMLEGNYKLSIQQFYNIYHQYPKSPIAPQALYSAGWILENQIFLLDSAASVYDTLITKYPLSVYVKNVIKKVTAYKQEKIRIQKAIQDSIIALDKLKSDSTHIAKNVVNSDTLDNIEDVLAAGDESDINLIEPLDPKKNAILDQRHTVLNSRKKLDPLWDPRKHFN